jgi:ABC-type nitrate/sulfonate/bicarbonate transport system permease component
VPFSKRVRDLAPGVAFLLALFALLEFVTRLHLVNAVIVPPPTAVIATFFGMFTQREVGVALLQTLETLFIGYAIGCALAIVLGILMGAFRAIYDLFEPITEFLRPVPKPALLPALMLFLGLGTTMKVTIVALSVFFPVLINAAQGARAVEPTMIAMAKTFGHSRLTVLRKVLLPATMPYILAGMRISLAIGIVVVVLAEMLTSNGGVGTQIADMQHQFFVKQTYAWVLLLALLGLALNGIFVAVERRVLFWHAQSVDPS